MRARIDGTARAGADAADPAKILLYGDSLTMGFSGDWTWRYRVWRDLTSAGQQFDSVGPRDDLLEFVSYRPGSQGYRDPHFDRDHAAYSGMTFTRPLWEPSALVDHYQADVVVGLVGINDLFQRLRAPLQLATKWRSQIEQARLRQPRVDFVLVQMPLTWVPGVAEYNAWLIRLAAAVDTPESRVVWAPTPSVTVKAGTLTATWDPVDYAAQDLHVVDVTANEDTADNSVVQRSRGRRGRSRWNRGTAIASGWLP